MKDSLKARNSHPIKKVVCEQSVVLGHRINSFPDTLRNSLENRLTRESSIAKVIMKQFHFKLLFIVIQVITVNSCSLCNTVDLEELNDANIDIIEKDMSSKYVPMCLFYLSNSVVPRLGRSIKKAFRSEVFREGAGFIVERYEKCFKNFY